MEFLEVPIFDDDIFKLLVRFFFNVVFLTLMVRFAIYPTQRDREFAFTAVMMNVTVFFICFSLKKLDLGIGMALGLFAIFGVLRYRTDAIRPKEMTYLFIVIGIAVINSLSNKQTSYAELVTVNMLIFGTAMLKESIFRRSQQADAKVANGGKKGTVATDVEDGPPPKKQQKHTVEYDKLEWLGPAHRAELLADLRQRTGLDVVRVQLKNIDLGNSKATITIWCEDTAAPNGGDI